MEPDLRSANLSQKNLHKASPFVVKPIELLFLNGDYDDSAISQLLQKLFQAADQGSSRLL